MYVPSRHFTRDPILTRGEKNRIWAQIGKILIRENKRLVREDETVGMFSLYCDRSGHWLVRADPLPAAGEVDQEIDLIFSAIRTKQVTMPLA